MGDEILDVIPFKNRSKNRNKTSSFKSISNRALILAVLNQGPVELRGILDSDDVNIMLLPSKTSELKSGMEIKVVYISKVLVEKFQ